MRSERFLHRLPSFGRKPSEEDRADSFELAVSARRFSRRTQAVLDDKLSFSATLMRAGEVEAATRLLAEVGEEVLTEEVALLERVNEVKAARSVKGSDHPEVITRGRLARTLAVAMLGASLFAFSAAGAAVAGLFTDGDQAIHGSDPTDRQKVALNEDRVMGTRQVKLLKNVSLSMTPAQFRRYSRLTDGRIDEKGLESFLLGLLPPDLAEKVHFALMTGMKALPQPISEEVALATEELENKDIAPSSKERRQESPSDNGTPDPDKEEPTPSPSESPDEEPSPSPEETPGDDTNLPLIDDDEGGY